MRMRKKKRAEERIQACGEYMRIGDMLEDGKPVCLEIGCGKGDFICETALSRPDANFIAVERVSAVIVAAVEKAQSMNLPNARFITADAIELANILPHGIIRELYLNFSDPWPKRYHHHKRLTSPVFLEIYKKIMRQNAKLKLKTDNTDLFGYSLVSLPTHGFKIARETRDLYASEFLAGNIQTEYEKKFVSQGVKICYLEAVCM